MTTDRDNDISSMKDHFTPALQALMENLKDLNLTELEKEPGISPEQRSK